MRPSATTPRRPIGWPSADSASANGTLPRLVGTGGARGPPAYGQVIQVINEVCDADDYIVSAAGGLPGELVGGWRSKSIGSFDTEFGMSTMGYEIAGAFGADGSAGDPTSSRSSATAPT